MRTHFYHDASTYDRLCDRRVVEGQFVDGSCLALDTRLREILDLSESLSIREEFTDFDTDFAAGVVVMDETSGGGGGGGGSGAWVELVQRAWDILSLHRSVSDVEMQFVAVHRRTDFTMDMLIEGKLLHVSLSQPLETSGLPRHPVNLSASVLHTVYTFELFER